MQNIRERARIRWHLVEIGHGWLCEVLICRIVDKQGKDLVELARNLGEVEDGDVEADLADRACVHLMRDLPANSTNPWRGSPMLSADLLTRILVEVTSSKRYVL